MTIVIPNISNEAALRSELYARNLEVEEPERLAADADERWKLASALQKSVRRGHTHCAIRFAVKLHAVEPAYAWKRLAIIALEDVGFGDPLSAALALLACRHHRFRVRIGELRTLAAVVTGLAEAVKSRAICDALVSQGNAPNTITSRDIRAHAAIQEAPWLIQYMATHGRSHAHLGSHVLPVWHLLNQAQIKVQERGSDAWGDELIAGLPAAAWDQYVMQGKRVCAYLSKCPAFRSYTASQIGMGLFWIEGAHLNRAIGCMEIAGLELVAKLVDWHSVEITDSTVSVELMRLLRERRELVNYARKRIVSR